MKLKETLDIVYKLDYLLPIFIWAAIFGKNIFYHLLFVDFVPSTFFDTVKFLYLSDFNYTFSLFDILELILYPFNLISYSFVISVLIAMLVTYFYIKRLFIKKPVVFRIIFAFIYFFNAFVYTRIMSGQLGVLLAYLLIPVFLYYLFCFFKFFNNNSLIKLVISMTLTSLFAVHFFVINFIIFLFASFWFYFYKNKYSLKKYLSCFSVIVILLVLLNAFWIQGVFSSGIFSSIDSSHEDFFSPKMSEDIPAVAKIIGMYGFWREGGLIRSYISLPLFLWYIMLFLLILMALIGFLNPVNKKSMFFFTLFWIGIILGTGISHPYIKPFFDFLFNYIPLFNGFRDSHKLVSLIALSYAYLIPASLLYVKEKYKKLYFPFLGFIIIFFLLLSFPLLGLWNQQKSVSYPQDYFKAGNYFENQNISGRIIYAPWGTYFTYNWTYNTSSDGRIAVPINHIIKQRVLIGSDKYGSKNLLDMNISKCLDNKNTSCLEDQGVEYVIKDKCAYSPDDYSWFSSPVYETGCISIYKLEARSIEKQEIPPRFIIGVFISLITLMLLIGLVMKYKDFA